MTDLTEEAVQVPKACSNGAAAVVQHLGMGAWTPPDVPWQPQVQEFLEAALGSQQFAAMQSALTAPPLRICVRVNTLHTTPQAVAEQLHGLLGQEDSGAAVAATAAAAAPDNTPSPGACVAASDRPSIRNSCNGGGLAGSSSRYRITCHPHVPAVIVEGSGPHAVDLSTVSKQVLISRKAGEAVLRGAHVFIPGLVGCSANVSAGDTVAVMIDLGEQGSTTRGRVLPAVVSSSSASGGQQQRQQWLCAGVGRACVGRADMFRLQHGVAVELTQRVYDVPSLNGQLPGLVMLQNLPSVVAASMLDPPPGSRVLDMCASPGGKTTMLAQIMGGAGRIYALDRSHAKVDEIRCLAAELGCSSCITAIKMDATKAVTAGAVGAVSSSKQQQVDWLHTAQAQQPVSQQQEQDVHHHHQQQQVQQSIKELQAASQHQSQQQHQQQQQGHQLAIPEGLSAKAQQRLARRLASMAARGHKPPATEFRKHGAAPSVPKTQGFVPESFSHVLLDAPCTALGIRPRLQQTLTLKELLETAAYQRQLLAAAVRLVQPGGYLVYSTCSISPAENEMNVHHALTTYPCLQLVPAEPRVGGSGLKGPADAVGFAAVLTAAASSCADQPHPAVLLACQEAAAALSKGAGHAWWLTEEQANMVQRFHPGGQHDTSGFFAAKFKKVGSVQDL